MNFTEYSLISLIKKNKNKLSVVETQFLFRKMEFCIIRGNAGTLLIKNYLHILHSAYKFN
jgi:hypothetical protein